MFVSIPKPQYRNRNVTGRWVLGLAGAAAAWAIYSALRAKSKPLQALWKSVEQKLQALLPNTDWDELEYPGNEPLVERNIRPETIAEKRIGTPSRSGTHPGAPRSGAKSESEGEALIDENAGDDEMEWVHGLQIALKAAPASLGFPKPVWTAPLLSLYLKREYGVMVPLKRIRAAIHDAGYEWREGRYRKQFEASEHLHNTESGR
jgi:hypothetical protein